ncbi:GNAT family N-acetyltransferase [Gynurincola endophyticus]|jgi:L-amino acid N-acyltransferase YncA|uniref:GNAT family N-acetyltransferase n=1 Tax=Gynurincola endophyticus TaxID=2479004 RepID=UPI000F8C8837|nr:GNAT family N-acetyltransferase [Gynurincola endophyticus]
MKIRNATIADITAIDNIYNQAVSLKFKTADLMPLTKEKRKKWFEDHNDHYPVFVAEIDHKVVGYLAVSAYRPGRMALRETAEISYYIDSSYQRRGIGKQLIEHAEAKCASLGLKTFIAIIIDSNDASIELLKKYNYEKWGHLPNVAVFEDKEIGHVYYGKRIVL